MNFSFDLFGFDWLSDDRLFGFWLMSIENINSNHRSLLCFYSNDGTLRIELLWMKLTK